MPLCGPWPMGGVVGQRDDPTAILRAPVCTGACSAVHIITMHMVLRGAPLMVLARQERRAYNWLRGVLAYRMRVSSQAPNISPSTLLPSDRHLSSFISPACTACSASGREPGRH